MDKDLMNLVKQSLSIVSSVTVKDDEIEMWIDAGKQDLLRQNINANLDDALITSAIVMYVKANFGNVDIKEKELSQKTYNLFCHNLSLSEAYRVGGSNE